MLITLIGKNYINKVLLPQDVEGSYSITDKSKKSEKTLIKIDSYLGKWVISSNNYTKILNSNCINFESDSLETIPLEYGIINKVALTDYSMHFICVGNSKDVYVLYCSPSYEREISHLNLINSRSISIGRVGNNDIIYNNILIGETHSKIFYSENKWMIENLDLRIGTFVNNKPILNKPQALNNGDIIFIVGLKIIIIGNNLYVSGPSNQLKFYYRNLSLDNTTKKVINSEDNDDIIELYSEKDYFSRAPRVVNQIEKEEISITIPPQQKKNDNMALVASLGASMSMSVSSTFSLVSAIDGLLNKTVEKIQSIKSIATSGAMLVGSVLLPVIVKILQNRQRKKEESKRQLRYRKYVNSKIVIINEIMEKQRNILNEKYVSAYECEKIILNKSPRLWERKLDENDFLSIRIGTGNLPLNIDIKAEDEKFSMDDDKLIDIYYSVTKEARILENSPIDVSLLEKNIVAIISNNNEKIRLYLKSILMQLLALQSYIDLKLVFFINSHTTLNIDYVKMIPHIWDNQKKIRFFANTSNDMKQISKYLEDIILERESEKEENQNATYKNLGPYYLIITDDYKSIYNLGIINKILRMQENLGFSLLCLTDDITQLPNECKTFINIKDENCQVFENENSSTTKKEFVLDSLQDFDFTGVNKILSNIPIKFTSTKELTLPDHYNFLEMFNVGNIDQLNVYDRWTSNDSTISLQSQIGIDPAGLPIMLDAHEKFHGPHGLIAGTTGSGKSEFIITYILSLAINYHPDDVTFVLVDYKGGGLAGAFKKKDIQLPHLVGTITNIDSVGLQRSLDSIQSELRKRQIMFNEAKNITSESTIDIYKYQRLYHEGTLKTPISHLFIICDEFAELKQQQPEFMEELMSVSRIGRSLGVHLILATQKPAGIVNDQIRSNSKFGICLKVQDKSDSKDIIKKPDAANLKRAGQFYINVGNDEYFALGQSGWTGAPYIPSDTVKSDVDNSLQFISDIGNIQKQLDTKIQKKNQKSNGDQLTNIVRYICELAERKNIKEKQLWLNSIPENIYINDLRKKYNVDAVQNVINPIIGEYDDPFNQKQGILSLNLSKDGNTIIYGSADSGKEMLLNTILYDSMMTHSSNEVQFYILDYGSEALKIYKDSPHVGDILFQNESEKLSRLLTFIKKEIERRKKILVDYNGNYEFYLNSIGKTMPMIVVTINDYAVLLQAYPELEETIVAITRDCTKCGIVFIITCNNANEARFRLVQNFNKKIALQLINKDDYLFVFNKAGRKRPSHINGRGLITLDSDTVYEFQTAQFCKSHHLNSFIKKSIIKLKSADNPPAKPIPIIPNKVTFKDVKSAFKDLSSVPIGLSNKTIKPYTYNFKDELISIITSKTLEDIAVFVHYLLKELSLLKDVHLTVFDEEKLLDETKYNTIEKYDEFDQYNEQATTHSLCIIIGIDKFLNNLGPNKEKFTQTIKKAEQTKKCTFIVIDNANKIKTHQFDPWYKDNVSPGTGIWIGNGFDAQYIITYTADRREIVSNCGFSFAYAVKREKPKFIKLLGVEEKSDDDE